MNKGVESKASELVSKAIEILSKAIEIMIGVVVVEDQTEIENGDVPGPGPDLGIAEDAMGIIGGTGQDRGIGNGRNTGRKTPVKAPRETTKSHLHRGILISILSIFFSVFRKVRIY